ncbi:MAG: hypothetical protein ACRD8O_03140, partial [Bryobacteraceae bacterium]
PAAPGLVPALGGADFSLPIAGFSPAILFGCGSSALRQHAWGRSPARPYSAAETPSKMWGGSRGPRRMPTRLGLQPIA